jgi:hypothetical protein
MSVVELANKEASRNGHAGSALREICSTCRSQRDMIGDIFNITSDLPQSIEWC